MKKALSLFIVLALLLSALTVSAFAGNVHYSGINYATAVEVGTPAQDTMTLFTPVAVPLSVGGSAGAALGYTVQLEKDTEYLFSFKAATTSPVIHAINIMVLNNSTFEILSTTATIHHYGKVAATAVRFTAPSDGQYKLLVTEGSLTVDDYKIFNVSCTVSVDELEWEYISVSDVDSLNQLRDRINSFELLSAKANVTVTQDIDLQNASWTEINFFSGKFDGNNCTIKNFSVGTNSIENVGMFGKVYANAYITDLSITGISATGTLSVGALAGSVENSEILYCTSAGTVASAASAGGLVGTLTASTMADCRSSCSVSGLTNCGGLIGTANTGAIVRDSSATGGVRGSSSLGGFVGSTTVSASISSCSASGSVSSNSLFLANSFGGFIGSCGANTKIDDCSATGDVLGLSGVGGFVGTVTTMCTITNSFCEGSVKSKDAVLYCLNFGGFAGTVAGAVNKIENCYTISDISCKSERVGGFAGCCEELGQCDFVNVYAAGTITVTKATVYFGSFLGKDSADDRLYTTTQNCFSATQSISVGGSTLATPPACNGMPHISVTSIDFADESAVGNMTDTLNEYVKNKADTLLSWNDKNVNAKGGPVFADEAPAPGEGFDDVVDWVKEQPIVLQIPLWIFYIPVQYIISLFRGLFSK